MSKRKSFKRFTRKNVEKIVKYNGDPNEMVNQIMELYQEMRKYDFKRLSDVNNIIYELFLNH